MNIYRQQARNRRDTMVLVSFFELLITALGVGLDLLSHTSYTWRVLMLPFVLLTVISGILSFRNRAINGRWESSRTDEGGDGGVYWRLSLRIVIGNFLLIILTPFIGSPDAADQMVRSIIDIGRVTRSE